jgi:hypothetical protein
MLGFYIAAPGTQGMKVFVTIFSLMLLPEAGTAATGPAQPCILKAKDALSKVAGMTVKKASTRPMPPEQLANWKGQTKPETSTCSRRELKRPIPMSAQPAARAVYLYRG